MKKYKILFLISISSIFTYSQEVSKDTLSIYLSIDKKEIKDLDGNIVVFYDFVKPQSYKIKNNSIIIHDIHEFTDTIYCILKYKKYFIEFHVYNNDVDYKIFNVLKMDYGYHAEERDLENCKYIVLEKFNVIGSTLWINQLTIIDKFLYKLSKRNYHSFLKEIRMREIN